MLSWKLNIISVCVIISFPCAKFTSFTLFLHFCGQNLPSLIAKTFTLGSAEWWIKTAEFSPAWRLTVCHAKSCPFFLQQKSNALKKRNLTKMTFSRLYNLFYHHKINNKRKLIYITMYHLQRERTQGYRAPIANGTYVLSMKLVGLIEIFATLVLCNHHVPLRKRSFSL